MITRAFGTAVATLFAGLCMIGIAALIASDFMDLTKGWRHLSAWYQTSESDPNLLGKSDALKNADNITFFSSVPIEGTGLSVTTGIAFASAEDIVKGKTKNRWCYIKRHVGKAGKQLDLGTQAGDAEPVYTDPTVFTAEQLKGFGLHVGRLAELARSHCLLTGFDPRVNSTTPRRPPPEVRRKKPKRAPAKVWNWERPYLAPHRDRPFFRAGARAAV